MFNGLQNEHFEGLTTKQKLLELLNVAGQIVEHDVKIDGYTLDDCELANADAEDAFEELRSAINTLEQAVDYYVD